MKSSLEGYVLLVGLSVVWGMAFVAIKVADSELSFENLTLLRWLMVSACFLVLYPFVAKPSTPFDRRDIPRLVLVSLANVDIYHLSLNFSEKTVPAALAGLLGSLSPVFVVVLSIITLRERISGKLVTALSLAMAGAVLVSLPTIALGGTSLTGPLAAAIAALASGTYIAFSKPLVSKYGAFSVAMWASFIGTAVLLPLLSPSVVSQAASLSPSGWAALLYLVGPSTVVGNLVMFTLIGRYPAVSRLGVQMYLIPVMSVVGGVLILGESLDAFVLVGGALMLLAVAVAMRIRH